MVFGGLQKQSLIDFPGKLSCVLFTSGCNFDCPYCHNPDLVNGHTPRPLVLKEGNIYDFLEMRKDFLDGVVISGGEPTLHGDLIDTCRKIKQMGFPIKLDTNGSRPATISNLLDEECIDYIAMDIKTEPLRVGIIGEIYVLFEPFVNMDVERELGRLGVQVHRTVMLSDWTRFTLFLNALGMSQHDQAHRAAVPYLNRDVGGDGWESVGETILHARNGYDGGRCDALRVGIR